MKAIIYKDDLGKDFDVVEIPAEHADARREAREHLLDAVADVRRRAGRGITSRTATSTVDAAQGGDPQGAPRASR